MITKHCPDCGTAIRAANPNAAKDVRCKACRPAHKALKQLITRQLTRKKSQGKHEASYVAPAFFSKKKKLQKKAK